MDKVKELLKMKTSLTQGGGKEDNQIQYNLGKLTAKERILRVLDEGSFIEIGTLINNGAGVITGYGTVNGSLVYIYSQDYRVNGGIINIENSEKICRIMDMALKMGAPLIQILDSVGTQIEDNLKGIISYSKILKKNSELSGIIPQISLIVGPCEGIASLSAMISDFSIMVKGIATLCINSNEDLTKNEQKYIDKNVYGDAKNSAENGNIQIVVEDEEKGLELVKTFLNYIPSNNMEVKDNYQDNEEINLPKDELNNICNSKNYDIYEVINCIIDKKSFIEFSSQSEKSVITGLAKINGLTIGIIATNKNVNEGRLNIKNIDKLSRFIRICDAFNISIFSIVDTEGFECNINEEKQGLALFTSKIINSLAQAQVPKISLIIGGVFGAAYILLASKELSFDVSYAWPSAKISLTNPDKMVKSLYNEEITSSERPREKQEEILNKHHKEVANPYKAGKIGLLDDIIIPSETKQRIFAAFDMLQSKREIKYPKKHGSGLI